MACSNPVGLSRPPRHVVASSTLGVHAPSHLRKLRSALAISARCGGVGFAEYAPHEVLSLLVRARRRMFRRKTAVSRPAGGRGQLGPAASRPPNRPPPTPPANIYSSH